jgi:hypothetical protein
MHAAGATSPSTAIPREQLPDAVRQGLAQYVFSGVVREGAPDTFYYFEQKPPLPTRSQVVRAVLFWLVVIIIPVIIIQLSGGSPPGPSAR